ncbi:LOW QUALITY PROTEIN: hypothetical protein Cgig2_021430 [Carnegiea gigantea]|uniref:Uncharacterized protein n=1 Tax=Carnegiea gigantea TaxID=171969 RepID=A0A9Q1GHT4_9CARY|nr:LOW QUALITY PROTEIN: hypothetical protein Cgig2_021430 [Carnegiea gigantea]
MYMYVYACFDFMNEISARGGRGSRRGRGRGTGGNGQPPPQDFSEDQSNVPVRDPRYSSAYVNPNQPQGRGTPSQPLGIQATGADFFSTINVYTNDVKQESNVIYSFRAKTAQNKGEEPTDIALFSDTHQSRDPKTKGKWVDGKSQRKADNNCSSS